MSFVQWGEDVPPPLSPATGIDGPWLARLGLAAPAPPRRFPLPPSLAGVLGRPCSGRWHGHRRTGDLKGIETMTHDNRESWLNRVAAGMAPLFEALEAPLPDRVRVAIGFTSRSEEHTSELPSLMRISYAYFCLKQNTLHITLTTPRLPSTS